MTMTTDLARTPLHDWHVAHGGRMVDFAGWSMPVQYTSITAEHQATRTAVGLFDISHMGRLQFFGPRAAEFLDTITTRRVVDLKPTQVRYSLVCSESGGILDDVLVYGGDPNASRPFSMVVNASNRTKIVDWLQLQANEWLAQHTDTTLSIGDDTSRTAMIAVQGPMAIEVLSPFFAVDAAASSLDLRGMRYYHCARGYFDGDSVVVSRTGYTGEDGFEIICDRKQAAGIWERIIAAAEAVGGIAVGLGARDTLRLEAAMPLYGHELSEEINPIQAGLGFAVNFDDREFVGREALDRFARDSNQPVRVGLQLEGKRVPRQGCVVRHGEEPVGEVTSGTFSPTFERPIAMAYTRPSAAAVGTRLTVDIRGTPHAAVVVPLPFYQLQKQN
jgi:aminomethyltransferase